jgi:hypothetical protein
MIDEMVSQERWPIEEISTGLVMELCELLQTVPESRREWFGPEVGADCGC